MLDQAAILEIARLVAILAGATLAGIVALIVTGIIKAPQEAAAIIRKTSPGSVLRMVTVLSIVTVVFALRLLDKISAEAAISTLSGIAGYILGGSRRDTKDVT